MSHSEAWARRLIREIPSNPEELLRHLKYRDPVFFRLFLDHLGDLLYRDPREGLKYARRAPELALLVPESTGPWGGRERRIRAHAILAGAYRITGRLATAEAEYARAFELAETARVSPATRADLQHRLAVLRAGQRRHDEACELADGAVATCRSVAADRHGVAVVLGLAEALATQGFVLNEARRFAEAIPIHGETLQLAGETLRLAARKRPAAAVRVHRAARINLAYALTQTRPEGAEEALDFIRAAYRELRGLRRSRERHHCQWVEGTAWLELGLDRRAEQAFKVARRGFERLDTPWEIALVSLDLAALYRTWSQWADLETLAEDTCRRFRELCGDFEAITALSLWLEAVRARRGIEATIGAARHTIEARMIKDVG